MAAARATTPRCCCCCCCCCCWPLCCWHTTRARCLAVAAVAAAAGRAARTVAAWLLAPHFLLYDQLCLATDMTEEGSQAVGEALPVRVTACEGAGQLVLRTGARRQCKIAMAESGRSKLGPCLGAPPWRQCEMKVPERPLWGHGRRCSILTAIASVLRFGGRLERSGTEAGAAPFRQVRAFARHCLCW